MKLIKKEEMTAVIAALFIHSSQNKNGRDWKNQNMHNKTNIKLRIFPQKHSFNGRGFAMIHNSLSGRTYCVKQMLIWGTES